jgi:F-type H+-transporting ATPase subunit epsilon
MDERKIKCNIHTPEGHFYEGKVDLAVVPALYGSMGFLYNHAPLIAELSNGEVRLTDGNKTEYMAVEGGFVEINRNELSIYPVKAYKKSDLFKEDIDKEIKRLQELKKPVDFSERENHKQEIDKLKIKLKVANRK